MLQTKVLKFEVSNKALLKDEGLQYQYLDVLEKKLANKEDIESQVNAMIRLITNDGGQFKSIYSHNVVVKSKLNIPDTIHMYVYILYETGDGEQMK